MNHMRYSLIPVNIHRIHVTKFLEFHAFQSFVTAVEYKFLFNELLICVPKLLMFFYRLVLKFTLFSPPFLHVTIIFYKTVFGQLMVR